MNARGLLAAVVVFAALLLAGTMGVYAVVESHNETPAEDRMVYNESIRVDYNQTTTVRQASADSLSDERVYNADGEQLSASTDYDFDESTGEITWHDTSNTEEDELASVTYSYRGRALPMRVMYGILPVVASGLPYFFLVMIPAGLLGLALFFGHLAKTTTKSQTFR